MIYALALVATAGIAWFLGYKLGVKSIDDNLEHHVFMKEMGDRIEAFEEAERRSIVTSNAARRHLGLKEIDPDD